MFRISSTVTAFFAILFIANCAKAEQVVEPQGILVVAKMAGACGILDSMIDFQAKTKMSGGNEFVTRFWEVEATRLGMSVKQLSDQCNGAVSAYDKVWSAMEKGR
jgi:hypothetical protein